MFRNQLVPLFLQLVLGGTPQTGHPIIRPMVYEFPDDPRCYTDPFDFMLGSHLLVAPVLEAGRAKSGESIYPPGRGGAIIMIATGTKANRKLKWMRRWIEFPLLVRDGSIIPMDYGDQRAAWVFARGTAEFTLVEDDGVSLDYQRGGYTTIRLNWGRSLETVRPSKSMRDLNCPTRKSYPCYRRAMFIFR